MGPSSWVNLPRLPQTPNCKLDRAALPAPQPAAAEVEEDSAPGSALEIALAGIWKEVLQLERVSTRNDLFALGADSIQLFQITARANRAGIRLSAKQLMRHRTIAALAAFLEASGETVGAARPASVRGPEAMTVQ